MPDLKNYLFDRVDDLPVLDVTVVTGYAALKLMQELFGLF